MIIDNDGNGEQLASLLRPSITRQEAKDAVETLLALDLIHKNTHGKLKPTNEMVRKDPNFHSVYWATNMHAKINLALEMLETTSKEERDFSEVVVPLSQEGMVEVQAELAIVRKKILAISQKDTKRNRIYQCSLQLFPLSHSVKQIV